MRHADKKDVLALYDFLDQRKQLGTADKLRVCIDYLAFQVSDKSIEIQREVLNIFIQSISEFSVIFPSALAADLADEAIEKAAEQKG